MLQHPPHAPQDLPLDPHRHQEDRHPRPCHQSLGLWEHSVRRHHHQAAEETATNPERCRTTHPEHTPPPPHLRTPEETSLAPSQQEDHLQTPHPRTQSPAQPRTKTHQPLRLILHSSTHPTLDRTSPGSRTPHPQSHRRRKILLFSGSEDLELPSQPPSRHTGPPPLQKAAQDLALRALTLPPPAP
ncbi:hypothetical protein NDU88_000937 [Pleurodeles waltl]|uniref:Uncharacterized protein n=1 Tax=Pleurodeles waltl TaxID=8319 RepID=A0AAV7Q4D2_PLEWA|nr:hypothetical protein NDU88_000937 [Pleurodeles waltl]